MQSRMHNIGRYEIERELGRGAMGIVYLARDTRLGRAVALKTIRLGDFADAEKLQRLRERLIREAQSAGSLSHENIVTIYDVDELDEISYISMEYVEGDSLERMLDRRREVSREALLSLLRQVASGLDFAHSRGIVHRDVKPPNVMVTPLGRVKITDFGVAKITYASSMTQGGAMLGTPDYMSPEQIDGRSVDGRADQFSLGVIAFELLTGEKPFIADSLASLFYRIAHEPLPDATLLNPSLSEEVAEVLKRGLSKRPEERYPNCISFVDAVTDACGRAIGWHALPRGMSHTLPTAHDQPAAGAVPPVAPPVPASAPAAPPIPAVAPALVVEPTPVVATPPPVREMASRPLPALGGPAPAAEAGFITGAPMDSAATVEGPPPQTREWLRTVEQEEVAQRARRRRSVVLAIITFLVIGGALGAAYYWMGGGSLLAPKQSTQEAAGLTGGAQDGGVGTAEQPFTSSTQDAVDSAGGVAPGTSDTAVPSTETGGAEPAVEEPALATEAAPPAALPAPSDTKPAARQVSPPRERLATARFMTDPPGARITVDATSSLSCETPCSLEIAVGRHTYSARMAGYRNEIRALEVTNYGGTANLKLERVVGMVRVTSTPIGAAVLVNGERQNGTTPMTLRLLPGDYRIVIERDGRRVERSVKVQEDAAVQLSANLEQ
ncbi:MAG: serine/threonine protein kinase [Bryobacterales bacterium]|nr:serine/threonine protein kinase [Bryobacterales bacterium]